MSSTPLIFFFFFVFFLSLSAAPTFGRTLHHINFRSPDLFPESFTWDPKGQHFIVGSLRHPTILTVSDAGVAEALLPDNPLPPDAFLLGLTVDRRRNRLLAVVHRRDSSPFEALASFDLNSRQLIFLASLMDTVSTKSADTNDAIITTVTSGDGAAMDDGGPHNKGTASVANDVAVDYYGNAYVTSSAGDFIWKVNVDGEASILSRSSVFKSHPVDPTLWYRACGLNGIVYNPKGYLLVVQSNTGKLYKVDVDDGTVRRVILNRNLTGADGLALRFDGVLVAVSQEKVSFIKSQDSWGEGTVFDETALDAEKQASAIAVGGEERVYVLYGYVNEGLTGNGTREEFSIVEVESEKENQEENIWIFVLIGLGLAYFMFWRFQMRQLVQNINKKNS